MYICCFGPVHVSEGLIIILSCSFSLDMLNMSIILLFLPVYIPDLYTIILLFLPVYA